MRRAAIERRLRSGSRRLAEARDELRVGEEQYEQLAAEVEDARVRALVSEGPAEKRAHREAERHAQALTDHLDAVRADVTRLEADQDRLLDELGAT